MTSQTDSLWSKMTRMTGNMVIGMARAQEANWRAAARSMSLAANTTLRLLGQPASEVVPADRRFADEAWRENLAYDFLKQAYLSSALWLEDLAGSWQPVDAGLHRQVQFWTRQASDALRPTNFPWSNPVVLQETLRTGRANFTRGWRNWLKDVQHGVTILLAAPLSSRPIRISRTWEISPCS